MLMASARITRKNTTPDSARMIQKRLEMSRANRDAPCRGASGAAEGPEPMGVVLFRPAASAPWEVSISARAVVAAAKAASRATPRHPPSDLNVRSRHGPRPDFHLPSRLINRLSAIQLDHADGRHGHNVGKVARHPHDQPADLLIGEGRNAPEPGRVNVGAVQRVLQKRKEDAQ